MNDLKAALPASVTVLFPRSDSGVLTGAWTPYAVTLASLALPEYAGAAGFPGTWPLRADLVATWAGGGAATNDSQLLAFARQLATDWYRWRALGRAEARYLGVCPWGADALAERVEWEHSWDSISTRVFRGPWLEPSAELPDLAEPAASGFSGIRVTTTNIYGPTLGVKITWTGTAWNVGGYTLSTTRVYVPDAAKYQCGFYLPYQMNTGTTAGMLNYYIRASVVANGGSTASGQIASDRGVANADYRPLHAVGEASLAAGDYLELYVTTTDPAGASAGELSIDVPCQFWVTRLG